ASFAQTHRLKGNGQIFWEELFNWENPADAKGWTAPADWKIEDLSADDNGFVWVWTKDSMQGPFARRDGGYILNSTTRENGFLAIDLDRLNAGRAYTDMLYANSSITLPLMNFSTHPSVIMSLEQMFKYFNTPRMVIEVSNDNGGHWAEFDLKMGTARGINTSNLPNNQVANFSANISDVAAGQSAVTIKITWSGSMLYFWMLDDLTFKEGWDYDLKMNYVQAQLVDSNPDASAGFMYMMPKTQLLPIGLFEGSVINYGEIEQTNVRLQAEIFKNGVSRYKESSNSLSYLYSSDPADTLSINKSYTPVDYGHYQMVLEMKSDEADQNPDNNRKSFFFHVTDSVFARTPDVSEADESPWRDYYQYPHEGDLMAAEFDPIADCEASSISAYISKANIGADFKFVLMEIIPVAGQQPTTIELLTTPMMTVDSTLLKQGWVTLPLDPDGQGEKMKAGKKYLAAVQFWTYITADNLINRKNAFWLGSTKSYPGSYDKQWGYETDNSSWKNGSSFNKMIRLNINNHENLVDGILANGLENSLGQNYPNPFSTETQIDYNLAREARVAVEIRDVTGKLVQVIEEGRKPAGLHYVVIRNSNLDAGIYFYTLKAGGAGITRRMVVSY
ncbi:MAG: T9SS type A sorting domain-containing protein, partial [Bacteroidia bacterium]|nr:T9SS type A sorting domain-containing protein [Bacteroidia bacterium]